MKLSGIQARAVARGFAAYAERADLAILACAILPDHVHLVLARHRLKVERLVIQLKGAATECLITEGLHPFAHLRKESSAVPKCFARGGWKVLLDGAEDVRRAIAYIDANPLKEGLREQRWWFVQPYT